MSAKSQLLYSLILSMSISACGSSSSSPEPKEPESPIEQPEPEPPVEPPPEPTIPEPELPSYVVVGDSEYPYCGADDSDPDGDGWGWTGSESCVVRNSAADPDGDGSGILSPVPVADMLLTSELVNPLATSTTKAVFEYLHSIFGKQILSGQQDLTWKDSTDMYQRVINDTGKAPAIMGYDFMNYGVFSGDGGSGKSQTEEAITHWQRGGLVTFAWHWRDPSGGNGWPEFYTDRTEFRIPMDGDSLDMDSEAFEQMEADIEIIAAELQKLQAHDIPVLWRPLHEASGGWFWWGASGPQAQIALWQYLYDKLTNYYQLNNLIWVWNGQHADWYPGDEYVDIASMDVYATAQQYGAEAHSYASVQQFSHHSKLIAMSENNNMPDPDAMAEENAWWLYFTVWNDGSSAEGLTDPNNFWTGEYYNTAEHKQHVYGHELVITLDELPSFQPSPNFP